MHRAMNVGHQAKSSRSMDIIQTSATFVMRDADHRERELLTQGRSRSRGTGARREGAAMI